MELLGWVGRYLGKVSRLEGGPYLLQGHWFHLHVEMIALEILVNHSNVPSEDQKLSNSPSSITRKMLLGESAGGALCLLEVLRRPIVLPLE